MTPRPSITVVDQKGLRKIFSQRAKHLNLSGEQALKRIKQGKIGNHWRWADLILLASMLENNPTS